MHQAARLRWPHRDQPQLRCPPATRSSNRRRISRQVLDKEGDESKRAEVLRLFSKARAASALGFALSEDPGQLPEAIYEAIAAVEDAAQIVRSVAEVLGS